MIMEDNELRKPCTNGLMGKFQFTWYWQAPSIFPACSASKTAFPSFPHLQDAFQIWIWDFFLENPNFMLQGVSFVNFWGSGLPRWNWSTCGIDHLHFQSCQDLEIGRSSGFVAGAFLLPRKVRRRSVGGAWLLADTYNSNLQQHTSQEKNCN